MSLSELLSSDEEFSLGLSSKFDTLSARLSLAIAAVASVNASWVAAAANQIDGEVAWSAPQSTLQRQGGGVIGAAQLLGNNLVPGYLWNKYRLCSW